MNQQILNGWKEISSHLDRGVRTAQRWERQFGMPVHRPASKLRTAVVAFADELEHWLVRNRSRLEMKSPVEVDMDPADVREHLTRLQAQARDLAIRMLFLERQMVPQHLFRGFEPQAREDPEILRRDEPDTVASMRTAGGVSDY